MRRVGVDGAVRRRLARAHASRRASRRSSTRRSCPTAITSCASSRSTPTDRIARPADVCRDGRQPRRAARAPAAPTPSVTPREQGPHRGASSRARRRSSCDRIAARSPAFEGERAKSKCWQRRSAAARSSCRRRAKGRNRPCRSRCGWSFNRILVRRGNEPRLVAQVNVRGSTFRMTSVAHRFGDERRTLAIAGSVKLGRMASSLTPSPIRIR